jgi:PHB/PHA accumulation regulator DNA-binding domain
MVSKVEGQAMAEHTDGQSKDAVRVIRRYANRKLYDSKERAFTTVAAVEGLVRAGVEVRVVDHTTGDDVTEVVLARVLGSMLRASGSGVGAILESLLRAPGQIAKAGAESLVGRGPEHGAATPEPDAPEIAAPSPEDDSEIVQLRNQVAVLTALVERLLDDRNKSAGGDDG